MNKIILLGRLTKDPETRYSQGTNPMAISTYNLAVDRKIKKDGEPTADFIKRTAFGKNGEFAEKYLRKGTKILIAGHIQTGSYTNKDGVKVYTTDIIVEEHEFVEPKGSNDSGNSHQVDIDSPDFMSIPDGIDIKSTVPVISLI